MKIITEPP